MEKSLDKERENLDKFARKLKRVEAETQEKFVSVERAYTHAKNTKTRNTEPEYEVSKSIA